jgi:hypothetical protein
VQRVALLVVVALGLTAVAAGCGSDEPDTPRADPGVFVSTLLRTLFREESGTAWDSLHPLHREAVSRRRYVECERQAPLPGEVRRIEIVSVRDEPSVVPGRAEPEPSKAVTVRVTLKLPEFTTPQPVTHTAHVFAIDGRWAWVIGPTDYARYASGRCPAGAAAAGDSSAAS